MTLRGKERAVSPTLSIASTTTAATTATAATALAGAITKAAVPDVLKPEPFVESRIKFRAFYIQIRLGI